MNLLVDKITFVIVFFCAEVVACSGGQCCRPEQSAALQQHSVQHMQHAVAHAAARINSVLNARAAALTGKSLALYILLNISY
jgi:hypothetical protein